MDDSLLSRLRVEQARALLDDADPHHAVLLACDLLVAGVAGDAVVALATEPARNLPADEATRRLAAVTAEIGLAEPDLPTAVALVAADLGGHADDELRTRLDAVARTILMRLVQSGYLRDESPGEPSS